MNVNRNQNRNMSDDEIKAVAPSAFAVEPYRTTSDRYAFIPTSAIITAMRQNGYGVSEASQSLVRRPDNTEFAKHLLRFRQLINFQNVGDTAMELVLVNSHDGSSRYKLMLGMIRFACLNGLIVSDGQVESISIRHTGNIVDEVLNSSVKLIEKGPVVQATMIQWKNLPLTLPEQNLFAEQALAAKYDDEVPSGLNPENVLRSRRFQDEGNDLWRTFNRVQENLVTGGAAFNPTHEDGGFVRNRNGNRVRHHTRAVRGIDQNTKLNRLLWALGEGMAKLKSGE